MRDRLKASVIIVTYQRGHLIKHCLESLAKQTHKNFETVVVYKPSGDGTERVLSRYEKELNMRTIEQKGGYVTHALNMGLNEADGDVILLIDDDAVAFSDWMEQHIEMYRKDNKVGVVAGRVIPAKLNGDGNMNPLNEVESDRIFYKTWKIWLKPLDGLENYYAYFGKGGLVYYYAHLGHYIKSEADEFPSVGGNGANMSFLAEAAEGIYFDAETILGNRYEQLLALEIWRKNYRSLYNTRAKVYHLVHGPTLSRKRQDRKWHLEWTAEEVSTFFKLKRLKNNVRYRHYIISLAFFLRYLLKEIPTKPTWAWKLPGAIYGVALGAAWALSGYRRGLMLKNLENFYF